MSDFMQWYMIIAPLLLTAAVRFWALYAQKITFIYFYAGMLCAIFGLHGTYYLQRSLAESPNHQMRWPLLLIIICMLIIIIWRSYKQLKFAHKKTAA